MQPIQKSEIGWGDLNKAMNQLVRAKVIRSFSTQRSGKDGPLTLLEVTVDLGADQAEVVRQVRDALPNALSGLQIRTRAEA
jgi:hypothetical protein